LAVGISNSAVAAAEIWFTAKALNVGGEQPKDFGLVG
jgi:hypothetical protein